jgi:hypothetical protein
MLGEEGKVELLLIKPVQKVEGDSYGLAQTMSGADAVTAALRSPSGAVQQVPLGVGPNQPGLAGWAVFQLSIEPGHDAVQVLHAGGKDTGVDQHPADEVNRTARRQRVQDSMRERGFLGGEPGQQLRGRAPIKPNQDAAGFLGCE